MRYREIIQNRVFKQAGVGSPSAFPAIPLLQSPEKPVFYAYTSAGTITSEKRGIGSERTVKKVRYVQSGSMNAVTTAWSNP
jgi:hypothetical protein